MELPQQRERVTVDGLGNIGVGKYKVDIHKENDIINKEIAKIRNEVIPALDTDKVVQRQNIHRMGTRLFSKRVEELKQKGKYGPSYVTISDHEILELVRVFKGTGDIRVNKRDFKWNNQEVILQNNKIVGVVVNDLTGEKAETTVFKIHYSKNGIHIVPDYPSKKHDKR